MISDNANKPAAAEPAPVAGPQDEMSLLDIWGLLRRRKWWITFGLLVGLGAAGAYYKLATPMYESEVEILVVQKNANLPTKGTEGVDSGAQKSYQDLLATHIQLLQSRRIIGQAMAKHDLQNVPSIAQVIVEGGDPVSYIIAQLHVGRGGEGQAKDAHVLHASYRDPSPADAARVLSALVESYQQFLGETFQDTSAEALQLITQAKDDLTGELEGQETAYREFRQNAPLLWKGEESANPHLQRIGDVQRALAEKKQAYFETRARLAVIEEAMNQAGALDYSDLEKMALLSDSEVERLSFMLDVSRGDAGSEKFQAQQPLRAETARTEYDRLLSLMLDEKRLLQDYGSDHPKVRQVREQIEVTRQFLEQKTPGGELAEHKRFDPSDLLAAHTGFLRHDMNDLERQIKDLEDLVKEEQEAAKQLVSYELQDETLREDIERKQKLYDTVVERLSEINLIKDYGGFQTEVIAAVEPNEKQAAPKLLLTMALGGVLGLFLGLGLAYIRDMADRTFSSPHELSHALHLPIIAHVPRMAHSRRAAAAAAVNGNGNGKLAQTLVTYHSPKSPEAETFRGLRTSLFFLGQRKKHRVIQVTSPHPGDGKTTVATNLAISMAQSGKKVLLIDADMRRPMVHKAFHASNEQGLSTVITGQAELVDAVKASSIDNLWLLTSGPHPPNPADLLTSPEFEQLLDVVREQYDFILLDTPPVLAVSDPTVIAPLMDGIVLTVRIKKNGRPHTVQAKQLLSRLGAEVLGVVVNGSDRKGNFGYSHYGGVDYSNAYGYSYAYRGNQRYYEEAKEKS